MKKYDYSLFLFSTLTPKVFISSVKNRIVNKKKEENLRKSLVSNYNTIEENNYKFKSLDTYKKYLERIKNIKKTKKVLLSPGNIKISLLNNKSNKYIKEKKPYDNFIIIPKQRLQSSKSFKNNLLYKASNINIEPYKQYLLEKNEIEFIKNTKETEMKYYSESKRQQQIKRLHEIKTKYQGYDFSRQKSRESFVQIYLKARNYKKTIRRNIKYKKKSNDYIENKPEEIGINKIYNERKYFFSGNDELQPVVRYGVFNEKFQTFYKSLVNNPDYNFCSSGTIFKLKTNL